MKTLIIAVMLFATSPAHAMLTGLWAEKTDMFGYFNDSSVRNEITGFLGGPLSNNTLGYAYQLRINSAQVLSGLSYDVNVPDSQYGFDFQWKLYDETRESVIGGTIPSGTPQEYGAQMAQYKGKHSKYAIIEEQLNQGTYWLAFERDKTMDVGLVDNVKMDTALVTPEPSSAALFLIGAITIGLFRRPTE